MKKLILMILLIAGIGVTANAQKMKKAAGKLPKPLVAKLHLTAGQTTKVDAILMAKATSIDSLTALTNSISKKDMHTAKKAINDKAAAGVEAALTADQNKIYADYREARKATAKVKKADAAGTPAPANKPI